MPDIPLDFSALSTLSCARRYQLSCVKGIDGAGEDAMFGNAVHKFLEYRAIGNKAGLMELCTAIANQYHSDLAKLVTLAAQLDTRFRFQSPVVDTAGTPLVEYKFSIPYKTYNGYRIILCGTIDRIYTERDILFFQDYKTTLATGAAADNILAGYTTSFQIPFYLYIIHKYLYQFLPPPLDELALACKLSGHYTLIQRSLTPAKIDNSISINLSPSDIIYIEELIDYAIPKMVSIHERASLCPPEGSMYKLCAKCNFLNLCVTKDHDRLVSLINSQPTRPYDPTNFR